MVDDLLVNCQKQPLDTTALDQLDQSSSMQKQPVEVAELEQEAETFADVPMEPFPVKEVFPPDIATFVLGVSGAMSVDPTMVAFPVMAAMAGVVGASRTLRINATWVEYSCLWLVVLAHSGSAKTPAFKQALAPLFSMNQKLVDAYRDELKKYDLAMDQYRADSRNGGQSDPPEKPVEERLVVGDLTIEVLGRLLEQNPKGLLLAQNELRGLFESFTRYSKASSENYYLEFYDGSPVTIDRVSKAAVVLERPLLSIVGTIQPGILAKVLTANAWASGLAQRFIIAAPPSPFSLYRDPPIEIPCSVEYRFLLEKVHGELRGESQEVFFGSEAREHWITDLNRRRRRMSLLPGESARRSQLSKICSLPARWALIYHVFANVANLHRSGQKVDVDSTVAGILLADWVEKESARVLGVLSGTEQDSEDDFWTSIVVGRGTQGITARQLFDHHKSKLKTVENARNLLESLVKKNLIARSQTAPGTSGRPTVWYFDLNAHLLRR